MPLGLNGPGVGLPVPQYTYPSQVPNSYIDVQQNLIALNAGDAFVVPAGEWLIGQGYYTVLQFLDPVTDTWNLPAGAAWNGGTRYVSSDGFNVRLANLTGCLVDAVVTSQGSGFTGAPTLTPSIGTGATILPIIGGALSVVSINSPLNGAYNLPPLVLIPAPSTNPSSIGKQALMYSVITNGSVSAISVIASGAGYPASVTAILAPNPADPSISICSYGTVSLNLTASGCLTGAVVTNPGQSYGSSVVTNGFSISVSGGGGTAATVVPQVMSTVLSASITVLGGGYSVLMTPYLTTIGGIPSTVSTLAAITKSVLAFRPRPAQIGLNLLATQVSTTGNVYDGGLFLCPAVNNPQAVINGGGVPTTMAVAVLTLGGTQDIITMQPTP